MKDVAIKHAHQTVVVGSADPTTAELLRIALGVPTAECRCVAIDDKGIAIYAADIIYRSDAIQLQIDLLASSGTSSPARRRVLVAKDEVVHKAVTPTGGVIMRRGNRLN